MFIKQSTVDIQHKPYTNTSRIVYYNNPGGNEQMNKQTNKQLQTHTHMLHT